ncbi:MAG: BadF/BadG/BcrA/BcrD ATPase family protein [[Ruminococcus] torques]
MAGTGSIAYGQNKFGTEARAGGWDDGFSDEGSCYWLGKKALELFSKESDGRVKKRKVTRDFPIQF